MKNNKNNFSNHCIKMFEVYSDYLDGNLDEKKNKEVEDHIAGCTECRACMETLKKTTEICSVMPRIKTPEDFSKRLHEKIKSVID